MNFQDIEKLATLLRSAKRIACLSGAGMSTESNIPDYRSDKGLYKTTTSEEVFDIDNFRRNPAEFYRIIGPLYCAILEAKPNAGHLALQELETKFGKDVRIATQNIDGLHQRAGSTFVYEIHGTLATLTCQRCDAHINSTGYLEHFRKGEVLRCKCGGVFKPDITFYGENLPELAFRNSMSSFRRADLAIVLGTSLRVYPAASLPDYRPPNCPLVILNMTETDLDGQADLVIHGKTGEILSSALKLL